eukprot:CCRYP_005757-RA/>CCRYP_005757-RA protein AED:0.02 eAED:0.02 QI:135/1/1/1/1/1/2/235/632
MIMMRKLSLLWMVSQFTVARSAEINNLRGQKRNRNLLDRDQQELQRHLAHSAAERFQYWTPEKIKRATPLDFKLDSITGDAYLSGLGGNLELYDKVFARRSRKQKVYDLRHDDEQPNALYWASVISLNDLMRDELDTSANHFVNSRSRRELKIIPKSEIDASQFISLLDNDTNTEDELMPSKGKAGETDINLDKRRKGIMWRKRKNDPKPKNSDKDDTGKKVPSKKQKQKDTPRIRQLRPLRGDTVRDQQTFRAKVVPAKDGEISAVYIQLTDFEGTTSNYIALSPVSQRPDEKMYEVSLGGFLDEYAGTEWSYKIIVEEDSGVKYSFVDIPFTVAGSKPLESSHLSIATLAPSSAFIDKSVVYDAQWPYSGAIQSSTGRILFDFGSETHVCSGTVVNDGGVYNERSLILTAAHCAYDDLTKQFASNAVFIPDQADTTGSGTDFDCSNDKYGCWYLSFAVVEKGWAVNQFPSNAEFDYAFYVVHDYVSTHIEGYTDGLTGTLDQDIIPAKVDFYADPHDNFFSSFGYSEDFDPTFRYCSGDAQYIREVPDYTNLWLPYCSLQGGASGGPWVANIDQAGVGTIMSLNSWGFVDGPGMAGPSLQTSSGSKAECIFNVARTAQDPGSTRGYTVVC